MGVGDHATSTRKLLMRSPLGDNSEPHEMGLGYRDGNPRLVLDVSRLVIDNDTQATLDACSWLLQPDQLMDSDSQLDW